MKPRTNLILDVIIVIVFVVALVSGLPLWASLLSGGGLLAGSSFAWLHGLTGAAMSALVFTHILFHRKWIVCQARQNCRCARRLL